MASVTMLHAELLADLGHDLQAFFAESLEGVGRGARLVGAAAEELRAGRGDALGHGERLLAAFDRTRPGDDGEVVAADGRVGAGERMTVFSAFTSRLTSL